MVVLYNTEEQQQRHYLGHNDDVKWCEHANLLATFTSCVIYTVHQTQTAVRKARLQQCYMSLSVSIIYLLLSFFEPTVFIISVIFAAVNEHRLTS